jgi:hypothetical protein
LTRICCPTWSAFELTPGLSPSSSATLVWFRSAIEPNVSPLCTVAYTAPATAPAVVAVVDVWLLVIVRVVSVGTGAVDGRVTGPSTVVVWPGEIPFPPSAEWMRSARTVAARTNAAGAA